MSPIRMIARPLLGAMFVFGGLDAVRRPASKVPAAERVVEPLGLQQSTENLVRLNGGVQLAAGALLSLGIRPRLAATALVGSIVPTTLAGHRFWEEDDEGARAQQQIHFLKNLGLLGGLLLAVVDTGGKPSLGWRAGRAARRAQARVQKLPSRAQHLPALAQLPALAHQLPARAQQLPALAQQLPALAQQLPALVEQRLPSHS